MTTVQIKEGNQLILACDVAEIASQNEFIQSLVAEAQAASDGMAEREDAEGCVVTVLVFTNNDVARYALVNDCTPNCGTVVAISNDASELIDLHTDDMRAIRLDDASVSVGDRIAIDWDASQVNLVDCMDQHSALVNSDAYTISKMSNATARKYFLHDNDVNNRTDEPSCYFSQNGDDDGWGFWVAPDGTVDVDDVSANGELPSSKIVEACVASAKKWLNR